jgi:hypothetical protein
MLKKLVLVSNFDDALFLLFVRSTAGSWLGLGNALKIMMYESTGGVENRHRYQDEVEHFLSLATARAHYRRSGGRDGLVRFHGRFLGRATESMLAMLPEEWRDAAAPGVFVQGTAAVPLCLCAQ